jgi:O-antigen/teichoic acid export membrane protein
MGESVARPDPLKSRMGPISEPELEPDAAPPIEHLVGVGITWKLVGQMAIQLTRLMTVAILARILTPADYGTAAVAIALAAFAPQVADMGIGAALVQAETAPRAVRSTAFWAAVGSGVGLFLLMAALANPIAAFIGEPEVAEMVVAGGLTFAAYSLGSASQAVLIREMRFRSIELRVWFGLAVGSVIAIAAAAAGAGPWALVLQQLVYLTTFAAALWWRASWRPALTFSLTAFRELASFAIRVAGGRWARLAELLVLTLLIGRLASVAELGAWTFAMSMVVLPLSLIAIPIAEVLFSAFSRLRNEPERMSALWLNSIAYLAAVLLPLLLGLMVVSPDLIPAAFGPQWKVAVGLVQILSVSVIIRGLQSWASVYLDAVGRPGPTFWTQLASLCLTPLGVVLGVNWGIEGVAVCYVACQLIAVEIPMFVIVLSQMRLSPRTVARRLSGVVLASLVMAVGCILARSALETAGVEPVARLALTIGVGVAVYVPAIRWLAPQVSRRLVGIARSRVTRLVELRRRRVVAQARQA